MFFDSGFGDGAVAGATCYGGDNTAITAVSGFESLVVLEMEFSLFKFRFFLLS